MCSQRGAEPFGLIAGAPRAAFWAGIMAGPLIVVKDAGSARLVIGKPTLIATLRKGAT
jgi:hypothetical protein